MANENCGCGTNGTSPPGTTQPTVSSPVGSVSSYGGNALVARGPCRPAACPTPPVSEVPERVPYCASWVDKVTTKAAGMLLMVLEGCIYKLWSKCSGFVYYDRTTEQISVQDPKYVSSIPKENSYGFLAKVVPTVHTVCVDGVDECQQEIRQEMASQIMGEASCGDLVIARPPLCGDVPVSQSGDLDKQVRFDYLRPPNHEDVGCPEMVRFLVSYPGTRGPSTGQVSCKQYSEMYRLKLRGSQWGFIPSGSPLESSAKQVVLIQVPGGTDADPCFELRVLESGQGGIPDNADECDMLVFRKAGTTEKGWYAQPAGLRRFFLDTPMALNPPTSVGAVTTGLTDYEVYKAMGCSIRAIINVRQTVNLSGNGAGGSATVSANGYVIAIGYVPGAGSIILFNAQVSIELTADQITLLRTNSFGGSAAIGSNSAELLGYEVG